MILFGCAAATDATVGKANIQIMITARPIAAIERDSLVTILSNLLILL